MLNIEESTQHRIYTLPQHMYVYFNNLNMRNCNRYLHVPLQNLFLEHKDIDKEIFLLRGCVESVFKFSHFVNY